MKSVSAQVHLPSPPGSPEARALEGLTVVVTRPAAQARSLARALRARGARVLVAPLIRTVPVGGGGPLDGALRHLGRFDWVAFTSANGVAHVLARLEELGIERWALADRSLAAVGPATARTLCRAGLTVALVAGEHVAEGLAREMAGRDIRDRRVLVVRPVLARGALEEGLARLGARVEAVAAYRTVPSAAGASRLGRLMASGLRGVVALASPSAVEALHSVVAGCVPGGVTLAAIGPVTASRASELGYAIGIVARTSTGAGLIEALEGWYRPAPSRGD